MLSILILNLKSINSAINSNFRYNHFKSMKIKFTALNHRIESDKNKKINDNSYIINIDDIINSFDNLYNDLVYQFPSHIKTKVITKYGKSKKLPNSLAVECETPKVNQLNVDIVSFQ